MPQTDDQRQALRNDALKQRDEEERKWTSWYCNRCHVEVYSTRCCYCGKTPKEKP